VTAPVPEENFNCKRFGLIITSLISGNTASLQVIIITTTTTTLSTMLHDTLNKDQSSRQIYIGLNRV